MEIIEERTVGPSLGRENIDKGFNSVMYGFILLVVFMCAYYLLMGLISSIALSINLLLLVAVLVDAAGNVDAPRYCGNRVDAGHGHRRQRSHQRADPRRAALGRDAARGALQAGYERAWGTILDSNITTLIAGVALFLFGSRGQSAASRWCTAWAFSRRCFPPCSCRVAWWRIVYGSRKKLDKHLDRPGLEASHVMISR